MNFCLSSTHCGPLKAVLMVVMHHTVVLHHQRKSLDSSKVDCRNGWLAGGLGDSDQRWRKSMTTTTAWKDPQARGSELDIHPAGVVELSDDDMDMVAGGTGWACAIVTATIAITVTKCSPDGTLCGSCQMGTRGCC